MSIYRWGGVLCFAACLGMVACRTSRTDVQDKACNRVVRVAVSDDPTTLDPRQARDLNSLSVLRFLFEGLTRLTPEGQVLPALAERIDCSEDKKTYSFTLREARWSNGDPVTAQDFAASWKKVLDPSFPAPYAYQLFPIRGARAAKEGKVSLEEVGIEVVDAHCLRVALERPTPYFTQLTSLPVYFPVSARWEQEHPHWTKEIPELFVGNGAFQIKEWRRHQELHLVKNPSYWRADQVALDGIALVLQEENTALLLFEKGELDWIGSPLSIIPPDAVASLRQEGRLQIAPAAGTQFLRFNVRRPPFEDEKLRRALSYAIDRKAIVKHILQGDQTPATGLVPPSPNWPSLVATEGFTKDNAQQLFKEALGERELEAFPSVVLLYSASERNHKVAQALQQQWVEAFGIQVTLQSLEGKVLLDRVTRGDYQIALGSWVADIPDPMNFLGVFRSRDNGTNNTGWERPEYEALLEDSDSAETLEQRQVLLGQAESLLIREMPIAPIFYFAFNYVKSDRLQQATVSPTGVLDLSEARMEEAVEDRAGQAKAD